MRNADDEQRHKIILFTNIMYTYINFLLPYLCKTIKFSKKERAGNTDHAMIWQLLIGYF